MKIMKAVATTVLAGMVLGVLALPAAAYDTVMFSGTATVCADDVHDYNGTRKPTAPGCPITKTDGSSSGHNGLYMEGQPNGKNEPLLGLRIPGDPTDPRFDDKWTNRFGNFQFRSGGFIFGAPACLKFNPLADLEPVPCAIKVDGKLTPVMGIGAACGISSGVDGEGWILAANGSKATLWNVGWPVSAGGTLPIKGDYHIKTPKAKDVAKPVSGQFVGVVQAQGGSQCIKAPAPGTKAGASTFNVVGVVEKIPGTTKKSPPPPKKMHGKPPGPS